jgi:hypothetical protein
MFLPKGEQKYWTGEEWKESLIIVILGVCCLLVLRLVPLVLPVRLPVQQVRDQVWNTSSNFKKERDG